MWSPPQERKVFTNPNPTIPTCGGSDTNNVSPGPHTRLCWGNFQPIAIPITRSMSLGMREYVDSFRPRVHNSTQDSLRTQFTTFEQWKSFFGVYWNAKRKGTIEKKISLMWKCIKVHNFLAFPLTKSSIAKTTASACFADTKRKKWACICMSLQDFLERREHNLVGVISCLRSISGAPVSFYKCQEVYICTGWETRSTRQTLHDVCVLGTHLEYSGPQQPGQGSTATFVYKISHSMTNKAFVSERLRATVFLCLTSSWNGFVSCFYCQKSEKVMAVGRNHGKNGPMLQAGGSGGYQPSSGWDASSMKLMVEIKLSIFLISSGLSQSISDRSYIRPWSQQRLQWRNLTSTTFCRTHTQCWLDLILHWGFSLSCTKWGINLS